MTSPVDLLAQPLAVGGLTAPNRILRSATMEYMADLEGRVTDALLRLYYDLARGGAGVIITGCAAVRAEGRAWHHQTGVWEDDQIPGLRRLAKVMRAHAPDGIQAVQIHHQGWPDPEAASGDPQHPGALVDLNPEQIEGLVEAFAQAARRTVEAGFPAVAVHGAHGYLISQFFSPVFNRRTDQWGGDQEGRMRFPLAVCRAVRREVGPGVPILWKINTADYVEGGPSLEEYAALAGALAQAGVDLMEMSGGVRDMIRLRARLKAEAGESEAYFAPAQAAFRNAVGDIPLCLTGGIRSLEVAGGLLADGLEMVGMCRPLICEPDMPRRWLESPDRRRARCTSCGRCNARILRQPVLCEEFDPLREVLAAL